MTTSIKLDDLRFRTTNLGILSQPSIKRRSAKIGDVDINNDQVVASQKYMSSTRAAQATADRISRIQNYPAEWSSRILNESQFVSGQIGIFIEQISGKTGNPDAERKLGYTWIEISKELADVSENPPSTYEVVMAEILNSLSIDVQGIVQEFSEWGLKNAGNTLEKYYEGADRLVRLKANLNTARASGEFTEEELAEQQSKISSAEDNFNAVRSAFSKISGGLSIDDLAQKQYGPYSQLGGPAAIIVAVGFALALLVVAISFSYAFVTGVGFFSGKRTYEDAKKRIEKAVEDGTISPEEGQRQLQKLEEDNKGFPLVTLIIGGVVITSLIIFLPDIISSYKK